MDNRAKIFMAFSPLKGYYNMVEELNVVKEEKIELYDDEINSLNKKILSLKKGMIIEIKYYCNNRYISTICKIDKVDIEFKKLVFNKNIVRFQDIISIEIKENSNLI